MIPEQTIEYRYDTQLLIDGFEDLDEDEVFDYIASNFKGDSLLAVGGDGEDEPHFSLNVQVPFKRRGEEREDVAARARLFLRLHSPEAVGARSLERGRIEGVVDKRNGLRHSVGGEGKAHLRREAEGHGRVAVGERRSMAPDIVPERVP